MSQSRRTGRTELDRRLDNWEPNSSETEAIVSDLVEEIDYLERVLQGATDGHWPADEYY